MVYWLIELIWRNAVELFWSSFGVVVMQVCNVVSDAAKVLKWLPGVVTNRFTKKHKMPE